STRAGGVANMGASAATATTTRTTSPTTSSSATSAYCFHTGVGSSDSGPAQWSAGWSVERVPIGLEHAPRRYPLHRLTRASLADTPDKALDAVAGVRDLLERRRIAGAHMALPTIAERVPRHDHDLLLFQQSLAELVVGQPGRRDIREAVEVTSRFEAPQTNVVEALPHEPATLVVRLVHALDLWLAVRQCFERGVLRGRRHAHHGVLVDLHHRLDHIRLVAGSTAT